MARRAVQSPTMSAYEEKLAGRLAELEVRMKLLEAKVRTIVSENAEARRQEAGSIEGKRPMRRARPRPRCPGCLLELPLGHRGDTCVWCGFSFEAVPARP